MATQFVPCRDVEHAVECLKAGLLWINRAPKEADSIWYCVQHPELAYVDERIIRRRYAMNTIWLPSDFALLVEE